MASIPGTEKYGGGMTPKMPSRPQAAQQAASNNGINSTPAAQLQGNDDQSNAPPSLAPPNVPNNGPNYTDVAKADSSTILTDGTAEPFDIGMLKHGMLNGHIKYSWERNKLVKQNTDLRLLACLRMRKGVYSPAELAEIAQSGANSTIYMNIASTKCAALASWLKEILQSPGDRPCGLEPRHIPDLPAPVKQIIFAGVLKQARQMMADAAQAGQPTMSPDDFKQLAYTLHDAMESHVKNQQKAKAQKSAEAMEQQCWQQMDNGGFDQAFAEFIEYISTYPTAFLKGPFGQRKKELKWGPTWKPIVESKSRLAWKAVNPFDVYPAPLARDCQDRDFIERMRLSYNDIFECIGVEGYDEEAIRWCLEKHQGGMLRNWIWTDAERTRLENDTTFDWFCKDDLVDALHYWGAVEGSKLTAWGIKEHDGQALDPVKRYEVDAIQIGTRIIRCVINGDPLGRRPYRAASYEEVPGSIWGRGTPELCMAQQDACNAAARAVINNMGISSGPMVGINVDRIPPNEKVTQLFPWKIIMFNRDEAGGSGTANPPITFFQPQSNAAELLQVYDKFEEKADDATGIPKYSYGDEKVAGAGATLGGLSMLMGAAARRIRRAIANIDMKVTSETVFDVFVWCMLHIDDPQIKGDCQVVAKGSAALLIKEQMQQGRQVAMQLALSNPLVQQFIGYKGIADLLREYFKGLHLPADFIPEGAELDKVIAGIQAKAQMMASPPEPIVNQQTAIAAENIKKAAKIDGEQIKARSNILINRMKLGLPMVSAQDIEDMYDPPPPQSAMEGPPMPGMPQQGQPQMPPPRPQGSGAGISGGLG